VSSFRGYSSAYFREIPCSSVAMLMLCFLSFLPSVALLLSLLLLISVKFHEIPWLILPLLLISVKFRVNPWLMLLLIFPSVANMLLSYNLSPNMDISEIL
jgi:hypothetical protein